jgi:uncharacterized protein (DUF697 family)
MADTQELKDLNLDWEAEKLCRWGAARAGVLVLAPLLGTMALIANEVYMITRLAEVRGVKLSEATVLGLLGSLGATFVGQTLLTIIPFAPLQVPVAVSVTYGIGKAANAWIKAGRPEDLTSFKEVFDKARKEGMEHLNEFKNNPDKDKPLGDETKKFDLNNLDKKAETLYNDIKTNADKAENLLSDKLHHLNEHILNPLKTKSNAWISVQNWEQLSKGELVIPYGEIKTYLIKNMAGGDLALLDLGFSAPDKLAISLQHKDYGTLNLTLSIIDFYTDAVNASTHLKVEGFSVEDNNLASLVVKMLGDKLILAILGVAFDNSEIKEGGIVTTYDNTDKIITIDFAKMLQDSKLSKNKIMNKSVLDVLHLLNLAPTADGIKLKASITL